MGIYVDVDADVLYRTAALSCDSCLRGCYPDTWLAKVLVSIGRVDATVFNSSRI